MIRILLLLLLSGCALVERANELKAAGRVNLSFPLQVLFGTSVIPDILIEANGGIEWHSEQEAHLRELELLRAKADLALALKAADPALVNGILLGANHESDLEAVFLRALRAAPSPQ